MFLTVEYISLTSISIVEVRNKEVVARRCSVKRVFLKISQSSQENTCARVSFLIKLQTRDPGAGVFL